MKKVIVPEQEIQFEEKNKNQVLNILNSVGILYNLTLKDVPKDERDIDLKSVTINSHDYVFSDNQDDEFDKFINTLWELEIDYK